MLPRVTLCLLMLVSVPAAALAITGAADPLVDPVARAAVGSLAGPGGHVCNATRIRPGWIITADHCLDEGPLDFMTGDGRRLTTSRAVRAPKHDLALLGIADDAPGGAVIPLRRPETPCDYGGGQSATDAGRIITFRHRANGGIPATRVPVTARFARTFRDCSVYNAETTYLTSSDTDPAAFALCAGDSGSPVVTDGPEGMALRGVISGAIIVGGGVCSDQRPTGTLALADARSGWIDAATAAPPPRTPLRIRRGEIAGQGRVALRGIRDGALARGAATVTWLRAGRPVMRRTQRLLTEWRPLLIRGPRAPGRYRVRIDWSGGSRTSNAFVLRPGGR